MIKPEDYPKTLEYRRWRLEEAALQYARMKTLGRYLDNDGTSISIGGRDRSTYLEMFQQTLLDEAVNLLAELSYAPLPPRKEPT